MSTTPPQPAKITAYLSLEGGIELGGWLAEQDGLLQLLKVQLLKSPEKGARVSVRKDMRGELQVELEGGDVGFAVTVSGITGGDLALAVDNPADTGLARSLRALRGETADSGNQTQAAPADTPKGATPATPRAPAAAADPELFYQLRERSHQQLADLLAQFMAALQAHLQELADTIKTPNSGAHPMQAAARTVHKMAEPIARDTLAAIDACFDQLQPASGNNKNGAGADSLDDLGLVDLQEFESHLAIDRMVAMGRDLHRQALEALQIRFASLVGVEPGDLAMPLHVRQLSRAFQKAMAGAGLPPEALPQSYDFFATHLIRNLGPFYADLNALLSRQGVMPELEEEIRRKGSLLGGGRPPRQERPRQTPASAPPGQHLDEVADTLPAAGSQQQPPVTGGGRASPQESLYQAVISALASRAGGGAGFPPSGEIAGSWDGEAVPRSEVGDGPLADPGAIASAIASLQQDTAARESLAELGSIRALLARNRGQLPQLSEASGMTADSLSQLELVDNLFDTLRNSLNLSTGLQPALSSLQIPLARLALLDQRMFQNPDHPARALVDKLAALADAGNFPNPALEGRITQLVDDIVHHYDGDEGTFSDALERVDQLVNQQQRALARNVERVVKTQQGQERLETARKQVAAALQERVRPPQAPQALVDLVEAGWRDLLVLTHVKEGPQSTAWMGQLATFDRLVALLEAREAGQPVTGAEQVLAEVGAQLAEALPTNLKHPPVMKQLQQILASDAELALAPVAEPEADPGQRLQERVQELPRLRRWLKRVAKLETGSWLSYRNAQGDKARMQLAWISEAGDRFIFVNERGQKAADLSAVQLARKLSHGTTPPPPTDGLAAVDRSMYQALERVQQTLGFERSHDKLTRLINRDTFFRQVDRALRHTRAKQSEHSLLLLDIDRFNLVNELYDRENGDRVLAEFSQLLGQLNGPKCSTSRLEGDRFAVLALDTDSERAQAMAEKIRTDIEASTLDIEGQAVSFTVSMGVAPVLARCSSPEAALGLAASAAAEAKQAGGNRSCLYRDDPAQEQAFDDERKMVRDDINNSLATDRLVLRAQPIVQTAVDTRGASSRHFEILLALREPDGSLAPPGDFIAAAGRHGMMGAVDRWVVRASFNWISQLMDAEKEVPRLSINLSAASLSDDAFLEFLLEQISEYGIGTSMICFEFTEADTLANTVKAADFVRTLREIGCRFTVDDFGTREDSYSYLREMPVDYVKIDGSLVTRVDEDESAYGMTRSINDLAHFLGQETVAESVENDRLVTRLREIGVDYLQGWGIGMPRELGAVTEDLTNLTR